VNVAARSYATIVGGANGACLANWDAPVPGVCGFPLSFNAGDTGIAFTFSGYAPVSLITGPGSQNWLKIASIEYDNADPNPATSIWRLSDANTGSGQVELVASGTQIQASAAQVFTNVEQTANPVIELGLNIPSTGGSGVITTVPVTVTVPGSVVCACVMLGSNGWNAFTDSNFTAVLSLYTVVGLKYITASLPGQYSVELAYYASNYAWGYNYGVVVLEPKELVSPELDLDPDTLSIEQGSSGTAIVGVLVSSGHTQTEVAWSASNLPSGVDVVFSPNPVSLQPFGAGDAASSEFTLTVSGATVPGTYSFDIIGTTIPSSYVGTITFELTVTAAPLPPPPPPEEGLKLQAVAATLTLINN
jgi:hypothetical protein